MAVNNHSEENIKTVSVREHVRLRPGMYLGSILEGARSQLIFDIIYEFLSNIPTEKNILIEINLKIDHFLEIKFPSDYTISQWEGNRITHPFGLPYLSITNYLSQYFEVNTQSENWVYEKGILKSQTAHTVQTSTTNILLQLDKEIFENDNSFNYALLYKYLRPLSIFNKNVGIILKNEQTPILIQNYLHYENGVSDYLQELRFIKNRYGSYYNEHKPIFYIHEKREAIEYHFGFYFNDYKAYNSIQSYACGTHTVEGGSLVNGILDGILKATRTLMKENKGWLKNDIYGFSKKDFSFKKKLLKKNIVLYASVNLENPIFEGSTRGKLSVPLVYKEVKEMTFQKLYNHFTPNNLNSIKAFLDIFDTE